MAPATACYRKEQTMFPSPDPRREISRLDEPGVWQEITRVARAALRDAAEVDSAQPPIRTQIRTLSAGGEVWHVHAQPLLQAGSGQPVMVVAVERVAGGFQSMPLETMSLQAMPMLDLSSAPQPAPTSAPAPAEVQVTPPAGAIDPRVDEVRNRFGLSQRQAEVATLLARRLSDKEIAARLGISRHTARRHAEIVLMRLCVHSRTEVGEMLAGAA